MHKRSLAVAGIVTGALALAGCTASGDTSTSTTSDAVTTVEDAAEDTTTTTATATGDLTEVSYDDLDIKDVAIPFDEGDAIAITLSDSGSTGATGVTVEGDTVTITEGGTYRLSGTLSSGTVVVDTDDEDVNLILDGVDITSPDTGALDIENADEVVIWLADGSTNTLSDAAGATNNTDESYDGPNATLYSTADLWIAGTGALTVDGVANDGITSKDGLVIEGGTIDVTAADDGIRGKDFLVVNDGDITVDAGGDGLKSDNEADADDTSKAVGVIWVADGTLDITAGVDTLDAANQVTIEGGDLTLTAGDDGITTDGVVHVSDGTLAITESYEGIEGAIIRLTGGTGTIASSDDGLNVNGGTDATGTTGDAGGMGGARDDRPDMGDMGGGPGGATTDGSTADGASTTTGTDASSTVTQATYSTADSATTATTETVAGPGGGGMGGMDQVAEGHYLEITGGEWFIDADGDGLDSNGTASMSGGLVIVNGPTNNGNGALDVNGTFEISGGTLVASGSSGMLETPEAAGDQGVLTIAFASSIEEGTVVTVSDADGDAVASFTTGKLSQSVVLSTDGIVSGDEYTITVGASVSGDAAGGLVLGGSVTGGTELGTLTAD